LSAVLGDGFADDSWRATTPGRRLCQDRFGCARCGGGYARLPLPTYVYNDAQELTTITQSIGGTAGPEVTMTYDPAGLLTTTTRSIAGTGDDLFSLDSYDSAENLTGVSAQFGTIGSSPATLSMERLPFGGVTTVDDDSSYNSAGQVTGTTFQLGQSSESNSYTDALGQRIGIKDNGTQTWTVYNGNSADANPYADFNSSGGLQARYLDGLAVDQILGHTNSSGSTEWYLTDQLGSVVAIASTSAVLDQITYDPFGNIATQTNATDAVRFGFAGMEYDSTTGLYYDHARYYDAVIGRFTSQDPKSFAAGDTNLYRYVGNEPTCSADPTGEIDWPVWLGGQLIVAPGFKVPPGTTMQFIHEQYKRDLPTLPMQRRLPGNGTTTPADAIIIGGPRGGLFKIENGSIVFLANDMWGNIVITTWVDPLWGSNKWFPANGPNTFHADIPGTPINEGSLLTPGEKLARRQGQPAKMAQ
jgi:RHS repeat-associated protein